MSESKHRVKFNLYYKELLKKFKIISSREYFSLKDQFIRISTNDRNKILNLLDNKYIYEYNFSIISIKLYEDYYLYIKKIEDDYFLIDIDQFDICIICDQLYELLKLLNTIKNNPYNE